MKLTKQLLKKLILNEMKLKESNNPRHERKYDRIMRTLEGENHQSVAIMSGQNPMAQPSSSDPEIKAMGDKRLKDALEKRLREEGLRFERIGGKFAGIIEQSVLIWDPAQPNSSHENHKLFLDKIAKLNREFTQWGFVGGRKFSDNVGTQMAYTMYEIDYKSEYPNAYRASRSFDSTADVLDDTQMAGQSDYSFDPTSGDKLGIPLKWNPRPKEQEDLPDEERDPEWRDEYYKRGYNI